MRAVLLGKGESAPGSPAQGCCWGPRGQRNKPGLLITHIQHRAGARAWPRQDHSSTFQPSPAPATLKQPMPAAGKVQLGFCRATRTSVPGVPAQPLLGPLIPSILGERPWCGSAFGPASSHRKGSAGGRGLHEIPHCSQDETQDGQRWATCSGLRGPSASLCTTLHPRMCRKICCLAPGCAQGKDAAPGEQGRQWAEPQFLSAGDGEGGKPAPPVLCGELVGKDEHPQHLQMEPQAQGSPGGSAAEGTGEGEGVSGLTMRGVRCSHHQVPPSLGYHLLQSSLSVSGSPAGGWGLGCTTCTLSSRLPLGNTTYRAVTRWGRGSRRFSLLCQMP